MTSHARGIVLMLVSMLGFALGDAAVKVLGPVIGPGTMILAFGAGGVLIFYAMALATRESIPWRRGLHPAILARNVVELVAVIAMVTSLTLLPITLVTAVTQSVPIIALAGAALFLGERVGWRKWIAVAVAMVGVLVMIAPWDAGITATIALPIVASVFLAARDVLTRMIPDGIPNAALALWGNIAVALGGVGYLMVTGEPVVIPSPFSAAMVWLIAAVLFGAVGYYAVTASVRLAPVSVVTPFRYTRLLFAAGLGTVLFGERPGAEVWLGALLVVAAGLYAILRGEASHAVPQAPSPR